MTRKEKQQLVGQKFNSFLITEFLGSRKRNERSTDTYFKVLCDCGKIKEINYNNLISKKTISTCGCSLPQGESGFRKLLRRYKNDAKLRNLEFDLNKELFKTLTKNNCNYCNRIPEQSMISTGKKVTPQGELNSEYIYNGIDRLNNEQGYSIDNCVSCCGICNWMKRELGEQEFYLHIERIHNHTKDRIIHEKKI
jgi:hypothetical protein